MKPQCPVPLCAQRSGSGGAAVLLQRQDAALLVVGEGDIAQGGDARAGRSELLAEGR